MKNKKLIFIILIVSLAMTHFVFASDNSHAKSYEILNSLNNWHKEELDRHERPDSYDDGIIDDGETGGWILDHKERLQKLGYMAIWNYEKLIYELFFCIGIVDPKQAERLTILLNKKNIDNIIEGSVVYGIWVIPKKLDEAIKLLKKDSEKEKYWIQFNNEKHNKSLHTDQIYRLKNGGKSGG